MPSIAPRDVGPAASPDIVNALRRIRPWALVSGLLWLGGLALGLVGGLLLVGLYGGAFELRVVAFVASVICWAVLAIPPIQLLRYAAALARLKESHSAATVETALSQQRLYWTLWGSFCLAYWVLPLVVGALLVFVGGIALGLPGGGR